ncbi:MAG: hypothetical protein MJA30_32920 [Cytophagales bacterium]|nr:hypothetical protein [Cytophagales bacterium]
MTRKPTFAGKVEEKDRSDILFWAYEKTPYERFLFSFVRQKENGASNQAPFSR